MAGKKKDCDRCDTKVAWPGVPSDEGRLQREEQWLQEMQRSEHAQKYASDQTLQGLRNEIARKKMEAMTLQSNDCDRCQGDHEWKDCRAQVILEGSSQPLAWPSESRYGRFQREKKFAVYVKEERNPPSEHDIFLAPGQLAAFNEFFKPAVRLPDQQGRASSSIIAIKNVDTSSQAVTQGKVNFPLRHEDDTFYAIRPDFNTPNQNTVLTNHFIVKLLHRRIFWYEFSGNAFSDQMARGKKKELIERFIRDTEVLNSKRNLFATDYKHVLVSWVDLRPNTADKQVGVPVDVSKEPKDGSAREHKFVELRLSHTLDLDTFTNEINGTAAPQANSNLIVQALNIIISKNATEYPEPGFDSFQIGTNRFFRKAGYEDLDRDGSLLVCHRGYFSTIKPAMCNILLNVNTAMSVFFRPMKLSEFLRRAGSYFNVDSTVAWKYIIGVRVWVDYDYGERKGEKATNPSRRIKTIKGFGKELQQQKFLLAGDEKKGQKPGEVTVFNYLTKKYTDIMKPAYRSSVSVNLGTAKNAMWYAPETLTILPFQPFRPKLPPSLQDSMVNLACRTPEDNKKDLMGEGLRCMGLLSHGGGFIARAGIQVEPEAMIVPCKTLGNVKIQPDATIKVGKWNMNGRKYAGSSSCSRVFYIHDFDSPYYRAQFSISNFHRDFFETLNEYLPTKTKPAYGDFSLPANFSPSILREAVKKASESNSDLVIFLVPKDNNASVYTMFKQLCDQDYGLKTVCMNAEKLYRTYPSRKKNEKAEREWKGYVANVGMKVNMKLGGTNHLVKNLTEGGFSASMLQNTMILGADVTHPSPGSVEGTPSVAAVVGSVDAGFTKFLGSMRRQAPRGVKQSEEMIQGMKEMVMERLQAYKKKNKERYPDNIMYYRDGVSDSQYASVKCDELTAIRDAYAEETKSDKPVKITAIVTAKRHHTRLYPHQGNNSVKTTGTTGNVVPGTTVDSTITSPIWFDFFIVTHNGIKGTARPTHYFVLENQMGFSADQLQNFVSHILLTLPTPWNVQLTSWPLQTNKLCYTYVRSTSAVSYAPPAYYADRLCERGRVYLKRFFDGSLNLSAARLQDSQTSVWETEEEAFHRCLKHDWTRMTDRKNPWHPDLDDVMFWM
ncbi:Protein argonaute 1B [Lasiodiplodia hormozganensis]|uniref:Protein argonaute 1B n=1 Tax=Lasiodiplodia hormozganensis TaxID=869390 RepID=A0AA39YL02_9PEZI|nr:Protein argonaute 1B [Lasiodiplodia hormozganensis]